MRRPSREITIFSLSALDLFASAMGAFIVIALILFPYFLKQTPADTSPESALAAQQAEIDALKKQNEALKQDVEQAKQLVFLGLATHAKSFVILIDMSGSMNAYTAIVEKTMNQIFEPMGSEHRVQIIGFQGGSTINLPAWRTGRGLEAMTPSGKRAAKDFVRELMRHFGDGTPTGPALFEALAHSAEAIILLSDGSPNGDPDQIVSEVTRRNNGGKEIDSIAIGEYNANPKLVQFLTELARSNGGGFLGISN